MARRHAADGTFRRELPQAIERQREVAVGLDSADIERVAAVRDAERGLTRIWFTVSTAARI